jgi:hypothetical protein
MWYDVTQRLVVGMITRQSSHLTTRGFGRCSDTKGDHQSGAVKHVIGARSPGIVPSASRIIICRDPVETNTHGPLLQTDFETDCIKQVCVCVDRYVGEWHT